MNTEIDFEEKLILIQWRIRQYEQRVEQLKNEQAATVVDADHEESYRLYFEKEIRNYQARKEALVRLLTFELNNHSD
jgi:hypothetical protein